MKKLLYAAVCTILIQGSIMAQNLTIIAWNEHNVQKCAGNEKTLADMIMIQKERPYIIRNNMTLSYQIYNPATDSSLEKKPGTIGVITDNASHVYIPENISQKELNTLIDSLANCPQRGNGRRAGNGCPRI